MAGHDVVTLVGRHAPRFDTHTRMQPRPSTASNASPPPPRAPRRRSSRSGRATACCGSTSGGRADAAVPWCGAAASRRARSSASPSPPTAPASPPRAPTGAPGPLVCQGRRRAHACRTWCARGGDGCVGRRAERRRRVAAGTADAKVWPATPPAGAAGDEASLAGAPRAAGGVALLEAPSTYLKLKGGGRRHSSRRAPRVGAYVIPKNGAVGNCADCVEPPAWPRQAADVPALSPDKPSRSATRRALVGGAHRRAGRGGLRRPARPIAGGVAGACPRSVARRGPGSVVAFTAGADGAMFAFRLGRRARRRRWRGCRSAWWRRPISPTLRARPTYSEALDLLEGGVAPASVGDGVELVEEATVVEAARSSGERRDRVGGARRAARQGGGGARRAAHAHRRERAPRRRRPREALARGLHPRPRPAGQVARGGDRGGAPPQGVDRGGGPRLRARRAADARRVLGRDAEPSVTLHALSLPSRPTASPAAR